MIARLPNEAVDDILQAIATLTSMTAKHDFRSFSKSQQLRWAVERGLQIISEAARNIPASMTDKYPTVPWGDIRGIGNILRHDYMEVSHSELWRTIKDDLKPLRAACLALHAACIDRPLQASKMGRSHRRPARK